MRGSRGPSPAGVSDRFRGKTGILEGMWETVRVRWMEGRGDTKVLGSLMKVEGNTVACVLIYARGDGVYLPLDVDHLGGRGCGKFEVSKYHFQADTRFLLQENIMAGPLKREEVSGGWFICSS